MIVINPIYDTAFKYLMDDNKAAKVLLSALLKREVVSLTLRHNELASLDKDNNIRMTRLDFSAKIKNTNGTEELVSIEIQKAQVEAEIMRFRDYLGRQYSDEKNVQRDGNPLHIITIYLLGHTIPEFKESIIYAGPSYKDSFDNSISPIAPRNEKEKKQMQFIRGLTHDVIVVQIPLLEKRPRNYVEKIMSIFDQRYKINSDSHLIEYLNNDEDPGLQTIISRLFYGASDSKLRKQMDLEKQYYEEMEEMKAAKEGLKAAKEEAKAAKEEAKVAKEEADAAKDATKKMTSLAVKAFAQSGKSIPEIALMLGITEDEVNNALKQ